MFLKCAVNDSNLYKEIFYESLMELLQLFKISHEGNSLNRRIKKLVERAETETCSDEEFNEILSNLQVSLNLGRRFNEANCSIAAEIPVWRYEDRLNRARQSGPCFSSYDGSYV